MCCPPDPPINVEFGARPGGAARTLQHFSTLNGGPGGAHFSTLNGGPGGQARNPNRQTLESACHVFLPHQKCTEISDASYFNGHLFCNYLQSIAIPVITSHHTPAPRVEPARVTLITSCPHHQQYTREGARHAAEQKSASKLHHFCQHADFRSVSSLPQMFEARDTCLKPVSICFDGTFK